MGVWGSLFVFLPPFADPYTFALIAAQCLWTLLFVSQGLGDHPEHDTTGVLAILTATLGFILPLQMNSALTKNKECLDNYNAFVGDVQAFSWDIIAFHISSEEKSNIIQNMLEILTAMPALVKWHFRGGVRLEKLTTIEGEKFLDMEGGKRVQDIMNGIPGLSATEACFYKLLDYAKDLGVEKSQQDQNAALRSWERAYGAWGNMGNLDAYKPPSLFTSDLHAAHLCNTILQPFQFVGQGYHAIWMVAIIGYFFLGLNLAGRRVGNAFAEGAKGYQTVTESQKQATKILNGIWNSRQKIFDQPQGEFSLRYVI